MTTPILSSNKLKTDLSCINGWCSYCIAKFSLYVDNIVASRSNSSFFILKLQYSKTAIKVKSTG